MIIRKCSQGHNIRLHRNSTPGASRTKKYRDGTTETLTYPSAKNYFVVVDGEISKQTDVSISAIKVKEYTVSVIS